MAKFKNFFFSSCQKLKSEGLQELVLDTLTQLVNEVQSLTIIIKENSEKSDVILNNVTQKQASETIVTGEAGETDETEKIHYTTHDIAPELGVEPRTVCSYINKNTLIGTKVGRQYIVERKDYEDFKARYQKNKK